MSDSDPYRRLFEEAAAADDAHAGASLGDVTPIEKEPVRFENEHALHYSEQPQLAGEDGRLVLNTPLFGLLGIIGPLPYFYSEVTARAERKNEPALRDFLGVFSHRAATLMYRAWRKSQVGFERHPGSDEQHDRKYSRLIASLTGASAMPDHIAWLDMRGCGPPAAPDLFVRRVRNARGLRQLLNRQFGMRFQVEEFVGAWEQLADDARSSLGSRENPPALGANTLLGSRIFQAQSTIRIVVDKPTPEQYELLRPGSDSLRHIQMAIRMYCTAEVAFRVRITVRGSDIKPGKLGSKAGDGAMLGWNTVSGSPDPNKTYYLSISRDYNSDRMSQ